MNDLDKNYQWLLENIIQIGDMRSDRTGTGTHSVFGRQLRHCMCDGFPLLTTKKMAVKSIMTELKWFLKGDTNIKYLVDNGCNIWNGDAYRNFLKSFSHDRQETLDEFIEKIKGDGEFAAKWGELGPIYGKQWRDWNGEDQIKNLIDGLKNDPYSRRHMVSAWNVSDLDSVVLPPCHYGFQCYVNGGRLSLMWNQRSVDTFLGLPFNIASYGMLLLLLCEETGYKPGDLIGNFGDTHLYSNHTEAAITQIARESYPLPSIELSNVDILNGEFDYELIDYQSHPRIKAPLSN
jgi:thymidylate synthase|tara:strand:+ start:1647 stop:2519 length:873 start_codon:yes stop_codon:yes gene_type:complete